MTGGAGAGAGVDVREARRQFPATDRAAYFNTAAVGLASRALIAAQQQFIDESAEHGLDFTRGEAAGERARTALAALIGAERTDIALIASVSAAAGMVAAQLGPARRGQNVVIGAGVQLQPLPVAPARAQGLRGAAGRVRNGGVEPDLVAPLIDGGTAIVACSGVQTATGHRTDIRSISAMACGVGAIVFVDGAQLVGALPVADDLDAIDVLATPDHKFLLHAGRGLGYCYLSRAAQEQLVPINAGWKAGRVPLESFFGPTMDLSPTASRFDSSISWIAAIGNEAALSVIEHFGAEAVYARNRELAARLRGALSEIGWTPVELPDANRSTIVSVPLGDAEPAQLLAALKHRGVIGSARDGNLRLAVHFYNHEDDIDQVTRALAEL